MKYIPSVLEKRLEKRFSPSLGWWPSACAQGSLGLLQCIMDTLQWPQAWKSKWTGLNSWSGYLFLCNLRNKNHLTSESLSFEKIKWEMYHHAQSLLWWNKLKILITTGFERVPDILASIFYLAPPNFSRVMNKKWLSHLVDLRSRNC